jgi:hypothetical protein
VPDFLFGISRPPNHEPEAIMTDCKVEIFPNGYATWMVIVKVKMNTTYLNQRTITHDPTTIWKTIYHRQLKGSRAKAEETADRALITLKKGLERRHETSIS